MCIRDSIHAAEEAAMAAEYVDILQIPAFLCRQMCIRDSPKILSAEYLQKVKALADIFRPYGLRVYLSVNFASPMTCLLYTSENCMKSVNIHPEEGRYNFGAADSIVEYGEKNGMAVIRCV